VGIAGPFFGLAFSLPAFVEIAFLGTFTSWRILMVMRPPSADVG
jgi:hypothetical protein